MLHDIIKGQEKSSFILITDEVDCCGRTLLLNFLLESVKRHQQVIMACMERPVEFFNDWLPCEFQSKLKCIEESSNTFQRLYDNLVQTEQDTAVFIDSLTIPLCVQGIPAVCQALHKLKTANGGYQVQVIGLLHRDVHDENTCKLLGHQASSFLDLNPGPLGGLSCHIRHCRSTGKVIKSEECFQFDDDFLICNIQPLKKAQGGKPEKHDKSKESDPTSQLTFNLSLSNSEKEARSQVILPYLKDRTTEEQVSSSGRIHYLADEMDDLDEEDPDDDLNI